MNINNQPIYSSKLFIEWLINYDITFTIGFMLQESLWFWQEISTKFLFCKKVCFIFSSVGFYCKKLCLQQIKNSIWGFYRSSQESLVIVFPGGFCCEKVWGFGNNNTDMKSIFSDHKQHDRSKCYRQKKQGTKNSKQTETSTCKSNEIRLFSFQHCLQ